MTPNLKPSQRVALVGVIDPDAYTANTYTTGWIDASTAAAFMALVSVGELGSSATVDAKLQQATNGSGAGAKDVTGKAITQFTQAGTDSDKQAVINLRAEELDLVNGFTHFRLSMTIATAACDACGHVFSLDHRYGPANLRDLASVDEIVG
ncbi:MAG TPA: hypothetical protein VGN96_15760 [Roseococcus sp.]|jgi:hypothetical protein|nr:hypothetical protein [Roseococcus sp.]